MSDRIHFISAGAGSGKTYSLTAKLEKSLSSGAVTPAGVIATTFTRLAAGELKERVRGALIEKGQLRVANQIEQALIGTVNSVCGDLLRRFTFEAGMPPDQQVLEETQGDLLFYQAMERALVDDKPLIRQMNATCHRLQILDQKNQLNWRGEVKKITDAARANNQSAANIRQLGVPSAQQLLSLFPQPGNRDLNRLLLNAIEQALAGIDTDHDSTVKTRDYLSLITGIRAGLYKERATWSEWIKLCKETPGAKSKQFSEAITDIAAQYATHPLLHRDIRFFTEQAFLIAADSLDAYQQLKNQKGLIDFVDQEQRLYQLLDHPIVQATLREELQLLMVDEFQDTSPIQMALFLKLSQLAGQVIWVGDIKQSIYGFRGSDPMLMAAVIKKVTEEGNEPEILDTSWRSTPELVAYTNNLFSSAFSDTLKREQIVLSPARPSLPDEPAVELWRLKGRNKANRAEALAQGIRRMMEQGRSVIEKASGQRRPARYDDIAILCRTNSNLNEIATALHAARLPVRYKRPGLLSTPEGCLTLACLRRLIDPTDTLASAEILALCECENPESWISQRIAYLNNSEASSHQWLEDNEAGPVAALKARRDRLPYLTPVEVLRTAIDAGNVRESIYRWGPTEQRSQHRLNNLAALVAHAEDYVNQCTAQHQPATSAGLVMWLYQLADAEADTQATGGTENAIQLATHHGAKGLEWPIVIAMDLASRLKPRLWGLTVLPSPAAIDLDDPLANRTLRYWPAFTGLQSANIPLLEKIQASADGQTALDWEVQESKRLLYVSLTRPRDGLIITMDNDQTDGEWMATLETDWMLPAGDSLRLPDSTVIPARCLELEAGEQEQASAHYKPLWLYTRTPESDSLPLRVSPSAMEPSATASIGEIIELGERLPVTGEYDPAALGSAVHAVIATTLLGQKATARVLRDHGMENTLSVEAADRAASRLLDAINSRFKPRRLCPEYPLQYTCDNGQVVSGWIDLLIETDEGFVLVDHKASPRSKSEREENALGYSGQLQAYADGISRVTGKPVLSRWIYFGVTGSLVEVR